VKKNIAFAVGTGRCGTNFLYNLLKKHKDVASSHERLPLNDTFMRYVKWYNLNVDLKGSIEVKKELIYKDLNQASLSFESSPYLSLSIDDLSKEFSCKFILLVRHPKNVIKSYINKGWYEYDFILNESNAAPSFQPFLKIHHHHNFSRLIGNGTDFETWSKLSQVGKLAYYYSKLNKMCLDQLSKIPDNRYKIIKIEEFDYNNYLDLVDFLGIEKPLRSKTFESIKNKKHNTIKQKKKYTWSIDDLKQYEKITKAIRERLHY
jgi:hypothetical protein